MKIYVTGGCGFIGSHFIRECLQRGHTIINYDLLTYAANSLSLKDISDHPSYEFEQGDIADAPKMRTSIQGASPDIVINFAAETHVDRSIDNPSSFVDTNVKGVQVLLDACLAYYSSGNAPTSFRVIQVSTDEVFGSLDKAAPAFTENSPYDPVSPYAASKASGDHLAFSYHRTYDLPVIITHCGNNYGPCQFPEKLIPHMILCALQDKVLPVYGQGLNIRDWIHVSDHVSALLTIAQKGEAGQRYLIGAGQEQKNIDIVNAICGYLDKICPKDRGSYRDQIKFVADRPGHDFRYALNTYRLQIDLGWQPKKDFLQGLEETVAWYLQSSDWIKAAFEGGYEVKRMGQGQSNEGHNSGRW